MSFSNYMSTTTHANFMPDIWAKECIIAAESKLVFANKVWRLDVQIANKGDALVIPNVSDINANTVTQGTGVTLNATTESNTTLNIDQWISSAFVLPDRVSFGSPYNLSKLYGDKAGYAVAKNMDTALATLVASFSQNVGTYGSNLGYQQFLDAALYLDNADAPMEDRVAILKPDQKAAMFNINQFIDAYRVPYNQRGPLATGQFGEVLGVPVFVSTNVYKTGSNTSNAMFHKEALALAAVKEKRFQTQYLVEYLSTICVADVLYGVKETRDTFGVEMRS